MQSREGVWVAKNEFGGGEVLCVGGDVDWVSGTPVSALSPSQGCLPSQLYPNSRDALAFVCYGVAGGSSWAGAASPHRGCALQPGGMGSEQVTPQAAALGMALWLPNYLAVASAGAGGAEVVLPESKRWNDHHQCRSISGWLGADDVH